MIDERSRIDLSTLLTPRQIALVGASDRSSWSSSLHDNLVAGGYAGEIHVVNPRAGQVHGRRAVSSIADLPDGVDVAFLLIGRDAVEPALALLAEKRIGAAIVLAGGYGEAGPAGDADQRRLVATAIRHGVTLLGPNDMGLINVHGSVHLLAQPIPKHLRPGGVALVSQSGAMATLALRYFSGHDIGLSHMVTTGNEAMIGIEDIVDHLIDDPNTRSLALLLEGVRDADRFRHVADKAIRAGKMIVACKIGRSAVGAATAAAHTGKLAGNDRVTDAMFRQLGVVRVDTVEDLIATAGAFDEYGPIAGRRLGVVTTSGGAAGMIADLAEEHGIDLPAFTEETRRHLLEEVLPAGVQPNNPLDATGHIVSDVELSTRVRKAVLDDPNIDVALFTYRSAPTSASPDVAARYRVVDSGLADVLSKATTKAVLSGFIEEDTSPEARAAREELGLPNPVPSIARAVPALARIADWTQWRGEIAGATVARPLPSVVTPRATSRTRWSEWDLRVPLQQAGVPVVPAELATSSDEAADAALRLGFPVALKIVSADLAHKSDIGGVALGVGSEDEVRAAYEQIVADVATAAPEARCDGVQIAPMRPPGAELIVGVLRDPQWGLALSVGLGGIWVEVLGDASVRVLPVGPSDVEEMLRELRGWPVISGGRGARPIDLDAAVGAICACVDAAMSFGPELEAFEVNPLRLFADGAEALDALVVMGVSS
jgi:acyl-CoA synthetase (NDP forming)